MKSNAADNKTIIEKKTLINHRSQSKYSQIPQLSLLSITKTKKKKYDQSYFKFPILNSKQKYHIPPRKVSHIKLSTIDKFNRKTKEEVKQIRKEHKRFSISIISTSSLIEEDISVDKDKCKNPIKRNTKENEQLFSKEVIENKVHNLLGKEICKLKEKISIIENNINNHRFHKQKLINSKMKNHSTNSLFIPSKLHLITNGTRIKNTQMKTVSPSNYITERYQIAKDNKTQTNKIANKKLLLYNNQLLQTNSKLTYQDLINDSKLMSIIFKANTENLI